MKQPWNEVHRHVCEMSAVRAYLAAFSVCAIVLCAYLLVWSPQGQPNFPSLVGDVYWEDATAVPYVYRFSSFKEGYPGLLLSEVSLQCLPPGTATVQQGGRLGNLILEYVSLWTAARIYNLSIFVPEELYNRMNEVFEPVGVPPAHSFVMKTSCPYSRVEKALRRVVKVNQELTPLSQVVDQAKRKHRPIVLQLCVILIETIVPMINEVRKNFRYRKEYRNYAQHVLNNIKSTVLAEDPSIKEVVFAGVHVRRTDYAEQLKLLYDLQEPADENYFGRAALFLKSRVVPDGGELVPVVASDDPEWVQAVLLPHLRSLGFKHSFMAGNGQLGAPEKDLAVLSSCNHSVLAYGTYGIWTALMAGGHAVVFNINHDDAVSPAMQFAQHLPQWVALS